MGYTLRRKLLYYYIFQWRIIEQHFARPRPAVQGAQIPRKISQFAKDFREAENLFFSSSSMEPKKPKGHHHIFLVPGPGQPLIRRWSIPNFGKLFDCARVFRGAKSPR